jgi:hypothetical protein
MRKSASLVAALVAAGSIAGTAHASVTSGTPAVRTLATGSLPATDHPSSGPSMLRAIRCWKTWQAVRDAMLHHTTIPGCRKVPR